nr:RNA-binding S4 domain-containing protein [uncultured Desulfobulbus sp.]
MSALEERLVSLNTPFIELDKLLKREDLVSSGGEARYLISEGLVEVNGQVETRKRKKLYTGDIVVFAGFRLEVIGTEDVEQEVHGSSHPSP